MDITVRKSKTRACLRLKKILRSCRLSIYFPYPMRFEYDPIKSQTNKVKHGIDFDEAQVLWLDEDRVEFPARSDSEKRHALLAVKDEKVWVCLLHNARSYNSDHFGKTSESQRGEDIL